MPLTPYASAYGNAQLHTIYSEYQVLTTSVVRRETRCFVSSASLVCTGGLKAERASGDAHPYLALF